MLFQSGIFLCGEQLICNAFRHILLGAEYPRQQPDASVKCESTVPKPTESYSSSGRSRHEDKELDNMRGFEPASEDDMDDNGMQRYFDANDDEAWD